jgi:hypothetical protein
MWLIIGTRGGALVNTVMKLLVAAKAGNYQYPSDYQLLEKTSNPMASFIQSVQIYVFHYTTCNFYIRYTMSK